MGLITQKEYALLIGASKQYVSKLVKNGVITRERGKINPVTADAQRAAVADEGRQKYRKTADVAGGAPRIPTKPARNHVKPKADSAPMSLLSRAKLAKVAGEAEHIKIKVNQLKEILVEREVYNQAILNIFGPQISYIRNYLMSLDKRIAVKWPNLEERGTLQEFIREEMITALTNLSDPDLAEIKREFDECKIT